MDGAHTRYRDLMQGGERMINCGVRLCHELGGKEAAASNNKFKKYISLLPKKPFLRERSGTSDDVLRKMTLG
jgi:hypothetical protein